MQVQSNLNLTTGYYDLTGPTATVTYEVLFSDPFSAETATIYPIVYYPAGSLPGTLPQANTWTTVTPATFAPYIAQPGGDQTTSPLGQTAGTPRFAQTTGSPMNLIEITSCAPTLSISSVAPNNAPVFSSPSVMINGTAFTASTAVLYTSPGGGVPTSIAPSSFSSSQLTATLPTLAPAGAASIALWSGTGTTPTSSLPFTITPIAPTMSWANPAPIQYGSALSSGQLNATASVPGTFLYIPPLGTVLSQGNNQTLGVIFTPTDTVDYTTATASINVLSVPPSTPANLVVTRTLNRIGSTIYATVTVANSGGMAASNVQVTVAKIGSTATSTTLPAVIGTIPAGSFGSATLQFVNPGASGTGSTFSLNGTYTGGSFGGTLRVTLP